jgi:hypothetical protein
VTKSDVAAAKGTDSSGTPKRAGIILTSLIVVAAVANLPLAMANVTLPTIGAYFDASQTQHSNQIAAAAKASFLAGDRYAYIAGIIAVLVGAALVFLFFPKRDKEREMVAGYHEEDTAATAGTTADSVSPAGDEQSICG